MGNYNRVIVEVRRLEHNIEKLADLIVTKRMFEGYNFLEKVK